MVKGGERQTNEQVNKKTSICHQASQESEQGDTEEGVWESELGAET